tara:strand:- start:7271 stop:8560 length:1290 start_codon:yes stop_codon:yes gene_type:complete
MALTEIPIELSSTPSIVDGGNATAITIDSSENVTLAEDVTFTGANATVVWDKSADSLEFADGTYLKIGTGNDLQIYHNGSNSYIKDTGTGSLIISSNQIAIQKSDNSETVAVFNEDGDCKLYYNDALKLATVTGGIDVTGTVTATILESSASDISSGENNGLRLISTSGSGTTWHMTVGTTTVDNSTLTIRDGTNNVNALRITAATGGFVTTPTAGGHAVFNEGGIDADFRVESDGDANMLFVNGGTNRVGIGSATPGSVLEVTGTFAVRSSSSSTFNDSSNAENVRMLDAGTIFNADGIDKDFTVASDNDSSALFVDGADGTTTVRKLNLGVGGGLNGLGPLTIGTSAINITAANDFGSLVIVAGNSGGNMFSDLVFYATTQGATVITGGTVSGSPAGRTYTVVSSILKLAMASGSYAVSATTLQGTL